MTAHLICLTLSGGLPLFTRKRGEGESLPFSVIASLNGVHMFGKSHNMDLKSTFTEDMTIVWKNVEDCVTLIAAAHGTSEEILEQLITSAFHAMVLAVGITELKSPRSPERLKRDLRVCYPILDHLLECLDIGDRSANHADILGLVEVMLCPENNVFQSVLDSYSECVDSLYGCVLVHGLIAVATPSWWELHSEEKKLLSLLVGADSSSTTRDIPVFLPVKSPTVPFRLVTCRLVNGVEVCVLCGPTPSLSEVEHLASQCWKGTGELLRSATQCYPRNFPQTIQLDTGVLGILMIHREVGKFLLSRNQTLESAHKDTRSLSGAHRLDVLRTFYYQIYPLFSSSPPPPATATDEPSTSTAEPTQQYSSKPLETYWCSEYHKCHALRSGDTLLCMLYASAVPVQTMRIITGRTLKFLTADKQLSW